MEKKSNTRGKSNAEEEEVVHQQFGPRKILGTGWFGEHTDSSSGMPAIIRSNTHFRITNPNCKDFFIKVPRMAIIENDGTLVYEGVFFHSTGGGIRYVHQELSPHIMLPITLGDCLPKQEFRPDADPLNPDQWMNWCCEKLPPTLMYTIEIIYETPALPPVGWQQGGNMVLHFDGTRSIVSRESQMITYRAP